MRSSILTGRTLMLIKLQVQRDDRICSSSSKAATKQQQIDNFLNTVVWLYVVQSRGGRNHRIVRCALS
jgi:hypothetical protein